MNEHNLHAQETFSFPVGYHTFHKNKDINFQLNRFYSFGYWTKADAEGAGNSIHEIGDWKPVLTGLAERHKAENRPMAAAFSYRAAEFYTLPNDPDKMRLYDQFIELFYASIQEKNLEKFSISFRNGALPALRLSPENSKGTIVVHGGFDSFMEELFTLVQYLADAGFEVIIFEGPGQGAAIRKHNLPFTHEWEHAISSVLDYFELSDITLIGISLGGYLALRAAAFEKRISRVVAYDISIYDQHGRCLQRAIYHFFLRNPSVYNWIAEKSMSKNIATEWLISHGMYINGVDTPLEWMASLENFSVSDIASKVYQDVLLLAGTEDHMVPFKEYEKNRQGLTSARSVTCRVFTVDEHAQNHCQVGNVKLALDVILDWIITNT
jgi:alpha-beta hydrolase superfamily lysophospholipase